MNSAGKKIPRIKPPLRGAVDEVSKHKYKYHFFVKAHEY